MKFILTLLHYPFGSETPDPARTRVIHLFANSLDEAWHVAFQEVYDNPGTVVESMIREDL
jgi:hypothetical protein